MFVPRGSIGRTCITRNVSSVRKKIFLSKVHDGALVPTSTRTIGRTFITRNVSSVRKQFFLSKVHDGARVPTSTRTINAFSGLVQQQQPFWSHDNRGQDSKGFSSFQPLLRTFSTVPISDLKKLDETTVAKIQTELERIDANNDRRLDADELMELLKIHPDTFTDEDAVEFRELFYAGKGGGTVSFEHFIQTLDSIADKNSASHPLLDGNCSAEYIYRKTHTKYTPEELDIELTHRPPENRMDRTALGAVKVVRFFFDTFTLWNFGSVTPNKILYRAIFLETIAAVPGFVAAISRHFKSLRTMERDGGLLHLFLEEANNERMHLLSFIKMKDPGMLFRAAVVFSQFGFGSAFLASYIISPKFCHRFVGYIEEEACATYTKIVKAIEQAPEGSELAAWRTERAPKIAIGYWELGEHGTVLDMMYAVRADEAEHRDVNHVACELALGQTNPYNDPEMKVSVFLRKYINEIMGK